MTAIEHGTAQLTPHDRLCLCWIAQQYAIRLDYLQRLLFRYTPEQIVTSAKRAVAHSRWAALMLQNWQDMTPLKR